MGIQLFNENLGIARFAFGTMLHWHTEMFLAYGQSSLTRGYRAQSFVCTIKLMVATEKATLDVQRFLRCKNMINLKMRSTVKVTM